MAKNVPLWWDAIIILQLGWEAALRRERWSSAHSPRLSSLLRGSSGRHSQSHTAALRMTVWLCFYAQVTNCLWFNLLSKTSEAWELVSRNVWLVPKVLKKKILLVCWFKPQPIPLRKEKRRFLLWLVVSCYSALWDRCRTGRVRSILQTGSRFWFS